MFKLGLNCLTAFCCISLGGCSTFTPKVDLPQRTTNQQPAPQQLDAVEMAMSKPTGSLYSPTSYRPMFEDNRARFVGDILTITISETIDATQSNSLSASRSDSADVQVPLIQNFFGRGNDLRAIDAEASSNRSFSGSGESSANNTLTGTLTVSVQEVLPNGYLLVAGEKQIGTNRDVQALRFSGVVNPMDIQAGNTVLSNRVADARIEYRGEGTIDSASAMGWLSRFFLTVLPF